MRGVLLLFLFLFSIPAVAEAAATYDATYVATLSDIPRDAERLTVWVPLPRSTEHQDVTAVVIDSPHRWTRRRDGYGNDYATAEIERPDDGTITTRVRFTLTRREVATPAVRGVRRVSDRHAALSRWERDRALRADRLVTLSPRVRELAVRVVAGKETPLDRARAIYDYVLATMTYDKSEPGWGAGDTERACDIRKGNCTDFHSLFLSLARADGIPARFVIGFPLAAPRGTATGYHCWAEFWIDGEGWIPVDASDAAKSSDPQLRDYLFGNLDARRVEFTVGRDLELTPATSEPLNYFIHPRGESNGNPAGVPSISLEFRAR